MSAESHGISVLAMDGIPEIRLGDDLPNIVAEAIAATREALPLRDDDVLVVTQKVVSKAEGAFVDLTGVEPRPEAIAFAEAYDRDAAPDRSRPARGTTRRPDGAVAS